VWRFNKGGLGYGTSYSGPFNDIALTSDGKINASRIVTGTLNADLIKAGVISSTGGMTTINMSTGIARMYSLTVLSSLKIASFPEEKFMGAIFPYSNGGALQLNNANEQSRANLFVSDTSSTLNLYQPDGTNGVLLSAPSTGGYLNLFSPGGVAIVQSGTTGTGGGIGMSNNSGQVVAELKTGTGSDGIMYLKNSSGGDTIYGLGQSGQLVCVQLVQTSSRKVKENIKPIDDANKILELDAVKFDYKNKDLGTDRRGFVAEDVAKVLPNLVTPETDDRPASLDYVQMIPYLQAVIKKQDERIKALEDRLNKMEG
jgi:hypothetical protein